MTTEKFDFLEKTETGKNVRRSKKTKRSRSKETEEKWVKTKRGYTTTAMEKKLRKHWDREIKKERRKERGEKGRKAKRDEQMDERKNDQRKSDCRKSGKMLKAKMWHRKGVEQKQKMKVSGLIFFVIKKWRERKD